MLIYVISQILCVFGLVMFVISMQKQDKKSILKWQIFSYCIYASQYYLLKAYSGMLIYIIYVIRSILFLAMEDKRKYYKHMIVLFIVISFFVGITTYREIIDIIPIINLILSVLVISQKNIYGIKKGQIIISSLWIIYDIYVHAFVAAITELIIILSTIKGLLNKPKLLCNKNR